jgi:hypothetical protein
MLATLMWLPAAAYLVAVLLSACLHPSPPGLSAAGRPVLRAAFGAALVLALVTASLGALGILREAFQQSVVASLLFVNSRASRPGGLGASLAEGVAHLAQRLGVLLAGDWPLVVLIAAGLVLVVAQRGLRGALKASTSSSLLFGTLFMTGVSCLDFQSEPDLLMVLPALVPFGGLTLAEIAGQLERRADFSSATARSVLTGLVLAAVLVFGLSDPAVHFPRDQDFVSLADQERMAAGLSDALGADQTVQSITYPWYHVLAGQDNATRFLQYGRKSSLSVAVATETQAAVAQEIKDSQPVVLLLNNYITRRVPRLAEWLEAEYEHVGTFYNDVERQWPQQVYVRSAHAEARAVIAEWPLE